MLTFRDADGNILISNDDINILTATVLEQITTGECVITNMASWEEAVSMADLINSGALPLYLRLLTRNNL